MFLIIMGVSGCGKTTVGEKVASGLGWPFYEGDNFHSPENIAKMSAGIPLNDADRASWLDKLADLIKQKSLAGESGVIACSALKQSYRDHLQKNQPTPVQFVYLKGSYDLILKRMEHRHGHYMKPDMLKSQFADLEEPHEALTVDITLPPDEIARIIIQKVKSSAVC